jgi:signal transduction histidine kinase
MFYFVHQLTVLMKNNQTEPAGTKFTYWSLKAWLLNLAVWGVISLAFGLQIYGTFPISAAELAQITVKTWVTWTVLTPLIFWTVDRFPIGRERWKVAIPTHLVIGFVLLLMAGLIGHLLFHREKQPSPEPDTQQTENSRHPPEPQSFLAGLLFGPHIPVYLAVLSAAHALYFYRRARERELRSAELVARLADARLQTLRMQIQPHFLFNSLNALGGLIHKDPDAADEMLVAISNFLRITLDETVRQEIPLQGELGYAERYLAIEKLRFGDRMQYSIEADQETLDALIPSLLLQPLVENAVRHGIEHRKNTGIISIRAWKADDKLYVAVRDNGPGLSQSPTEGIGLSNIRGRLRELYGDRGSLTLHSDSGSEFTACIPYKTA